MNDKERADALVERGVLAFEPSRHSHLCYWLLLCADEFVSYESERAICDDWRVAGACLERGGQASVTQSGTGWACVMSQGQWIHNDYSLPRAIIDAFLETENGTP